MDPRAPGNDIEDDSIPEASNKPGAKRRASRAGSRSVATLNAEQLARKRANDREAQRSIRQRTKDHVEGLENRIRELTEGQDINFEEAQMQNARLERELRDLKKSLQMNEGGMSPECGGSQAHGFWSGRGSMLAYPSSSSGLENTFPNSHSSTPESTIKGSLGNGYGQMLPNSALPTEMGTQFDQPHNRLGQSMFNIRKGADPNWASHSVSQDPRMKPSSLLRPPPPDKPISQTPPLPQHQPAWELPLRLLPPTCPVDHLLMGIIQRQRSLLASGAPRPEVVGGYCPSLRILAYPDQVDDGNAVSSLVANLVQRTLVPGLPERIAFLLVMYRLTQWQIDPSLESYGNLPEWYTPRASQLMTPHPLWVSAIPFGKLRDKVIANQEDYATDEFQALYTASMSLNWRKGPADLLAFTRDDVKASEEFERHCQDLSNWSLGEPFTRRYPELAIHCNFVAC